MEYSNAEYYDMFMCVGASDGNLSAARRLYDERHVAGRPASGRKLPALRCFLRLTHRLHSEGSFHASRESTSSNRSERNKQKVEEKILKHFKRNPTGSTHRAAALLGTSQSTVFRTLNGNGIKPYHYQPSVQLDYESRRNTKVGFCKWYLKSVRGDADLMTRILWTDEAGFTRGGEGVRNSRNDHIWAEHNPHEAKTPDSGPRWRINAWAGIMGGRLFGPLFIPAKSTTTNYRQLLRLVEDELDELPVEDYRRIIFQHNGAPAHAAADVREYLNGRFEVWVGRGGTVPWPAKSPDLSPMDFFLWPHVKNYVYAVECDTEADMRARISAAFAKVTPEMCLRSIKSVESRCRKALEKNKYTR